MKNIQMVPEQAWHTYRKESFDECSEKRHFETAMWLEMGFREKRGWGVEVDRNNV